MRVLVLSDTHMPRRGRAMPGPVLEAAQQADAIAHLGDVTELSVLEELSAYAPLYVVHGNNDSSAIRHVYPALLRVDWKGKSVVMLHGDVGGRTAVEAARRAPDADIVLFGHSHQQFLAQEGGSLLLNPGSPTDKRWGPTRGFAWLHIGPDVSAELVPLDPVV